MALLVGGSPHLQGAQGWKEGKRRNLQVEGFIKQPHTPPTKNKENGSSPL